MITVLLYEYAIDLENYFDGREYPISVNSIALTGNLFSVEKKKYIIMNQENYTSKDIKEYRSSQTVYLAYNKLKKNSKLYKSAKKEGQLITIMSTEKIRVQYIADKYKLDKKVVKVVMDYYNGNADITNLELNKLQYTQYTMEDVLSLNEEKQFFELINAFLGKRDNTIQILRDFQNSGEHPMALIGVLYKELKAILVVKDSMARGKKDWDGSKEAGIPLWKYNQYKEIQQEYSYSEIVKLIIGLSDMKKAIMGGVLPYGLDLHNLLFLNYFN